MSESVAAIWIMALEEQTVFLFVSDAGLIHMQVTVSTGGILDHSGGWIAVKMLLYKTFLLL